MLGAIIGDIVGSRFEWNNIKSKEFELFAPDCKLTDDSIMTLAVAGAIMFAEEKGYKLESAAVWYMQELGRRYFNCGYGGHFRQWLVALKPRPYNSFGNGSAMRVSPCAYISNDLDKVKETAFAVTAVSHNHPEGLKGAEATAVAIYMARTGSSIPEIRAFINENYYPMNFTLDEIRPEYDFDETCQGSVPQAIEAFLESTSFEDAIRNAVSIGGDSDTIAAITGSIAEAYYGIPEDIREKAMSYMDSVQLKILNKFESKYGAVREKETEKDTL